ncbi:tryptophan 7-halogenase [Asticcacaulis sp. ZE23SCel15]|uniref:tryptophan halogenase family protein n=1 Tax=Asticcacaulis sp. ZE23SCel15 TaxID=3059027 RepID=UPI00265D9E5B|nr:tryptophan halogenase family protein [Asticcacaulis sp. ZE23SCel15]WKL58448.1 tryptophan 7-halogenase [Asticcacaulis sp. ZE23SCel15]
MKQISKIVVVGGGTAGWMAAAAISKLLGTRNHSITLIESDEIGTVGVGEATIPMMQFFNKVLGLDENVFMRETNATFKLGIRFMNWSALGSDYFHPFGVYGVDMNGIGFLHYWKRFVEAGGSPDFGIFNAETMAARQNRFARVPNDNPALPAVNYAFHFDAALYARFLRRFGEALGVVRQEGKIVDVAQDGGSGDITSVTLSDGRVVEGDFFIDCSGFRGLLIEQTLKSGYEDWSKWLPCNRAVAVPCDKVGPATPYTTSTAQEAGWQWRIPLQHRTGNGYVFCDAYLDETKASELILQRLDGKAQAEPRLLKFVTGHRKKMWNHNVVAMGLSSGFLEPLESTSIYLVQAAISKLMTYFPKDGISDHQRDHFNQEMLTEYTNVKDFLIAHYKLTTREDTPFWAYCKHMDIPDSLKDRLESFKRHGLTLVRHEELFKEASWFAVLVGQGLAPQAHHPVADVMAEEEFRYRLSRIREGVTARVGGLPSHEQHVAQSCASLQRIDA